MTIQNAPQSLKCGLFWPNHGGKAVQNQWRTVATGVLDRERTINPVFSTT